MTKNTTSLQEHALNAFALVALTFALLLLSPIIILAFVIGLMVKFVRSFGEKFLGWPPPKPMSRSEAADMLDEYIHLSGNYRDEFDIAFDDEFNDPLLQRVAAEFFDIMRECEQNFAKNDGKISNENIARLRAMARELRDNPESSSNGVTH